MDSLPSLDKMSPNEWVEAMHALRAEVVEDAATILDLRTNPRMAAAPLQQIFDRYNDLELDLQQAGQGAAGSQFSLEVRYESDALLFWAFPTEEYESIVYTDYDCWWFSHDSGLSHNRARHEIHRTVILGILEMLPWANEDDLLEIAAIEMASRAGE